MIATKQQQEQMKNCRIWQLKKDADVSMRFIGFDDLVRKFGEPAIRNYTKVFDGCLDTNDLEQIYDICRNRPPAEFLGHKMTLSDVVELYDDSGSCFYYCDRVGFCSIWEEEHNGQQEQSWA